MKENKHIPENELPERQIRKLYFGELCKNPDNGKILITDLSYPRRTDFWHRHQDFYELVLVTGGTACSESSQGSVWLKAGSLQIFHPGSLHRYRCIRDFHHFNVLFLPSLLQGDGWDLAEFPLAQEMFFSPAKSSGCYHLNDHSLAVAAGILTRLREEYRNQKCGWQTASFFGFGTALTFLLRNAQLSVGRIKSGAAMIDSTINFMEEHLPQAMGLEDFSRVANMSPSSFRHKFQQITGFPPVEYLIRLRLKRAVALIVNGETPVNVARKSGFSNANYFSRQFKQHLNYSPREFYRKYICGEINVDMVSRNLFHRVVPVESDPGIIQ